MKQIPVKAILTSNNTVMLGEFSTGDNFPPEFLPPDVVTSADAATGTVPVKTETGAVIWQQPTITFASTNW